MIPQPPSFQEIPHASRHCTPHRRRAGSPPPGARPNGGPGAGGQPRDQGHPANLGRARRGGTPLRRVPRGRVLGLAPDAPGDADRHAVRGRTADAPREVPGRRPHPAHLLPRPGLGRVVSADARRLHRLHEGRGWRRVLPEVPLRRGHGRDHPAHRRQVQERGRRMVAHGRPLRLHVYAPRRAGPRSLGDRPRPAAERPHGGPARGRRLGSKRLVAGRQDAATDGVRLRERELPLARGRRER